MTSTLAEQANQRLARSEEVRYPLRKEPVISHRNAGYAYPGDFVVSYAAGLKNRQLDIFDDSTFLLRNGRLHSACVVARGFIEAYALSAYAEDHFVRIFKKGAESPSERIQRTLEEVVAFTNSSKSKEIEQLKFKKGVFRLEDYSFTEEARTRLVESLATSVHVMDALRFLYEAEREMHKRKESLFEWVYNSLSEWVHPSQTSVWHRYAPETQWIETSAGSVHIDDHALNCLSYSLDLITGTDTAFRSLVQLSEVINQYAADNDC